MSGKKYFINGDVLNAESEGSAQSHNNCSQTNYNFKMLLTPERKVPQRSDTSQNDNKSKGYPTKTSTSLWASDFLLDFLKSGSTALMGTCMQCILWDTGTEHCIAIGK